MNNERFIELLNLYIDGELPPSDAVELERQIAENPERRKIYRQYCQMQRACSVLAEKFREEAAPAVHFRRGQVVAASSPGPRFAWLRPGALVASGVLAACLAFVLVRPQLVPSQGAPAAPAPVASAPVSKPPAPVMTVSAPARDMAPAPIAVSGPAMFRNPWSGDVSFQRPVVFNGQFAQSGNAIEFSLPQTGQDSLDVSLGLPAGPDGKPFVDPKALQMEPIEASAFQFQR